MNGPKKPNKDTELQFGVATTSKNGQKDKSELEEINILKDKIERLTRENSELRREIARLKGVTSGNATSLNDTGVCYRIFKVDQSL